MKKKNSLSIDIESFSECDLKKAGMYRYAEHPSTEILCIAYSFGERVDIWIPFDNIPEEVIQDTAKRINGVIHQGAENIPLDVKEHVENGGEVRAHNAAFERTMLNGPPGQAIGFPHISIEQTVCTAAKAAAHALPRDLERAAKACGTHPKDQDGKAAMMQVTKPRKGAIPRYTPKNSPERFIKLYSYCCDDVKAEMGIDEYLADLSPHEQKLYELDQVINDRGIQVDMDAVEDAQDLIGQYKEILEEQFYKRTGIKPTQTGKIAEWISHRGYGMDNLQAPTVALALKDPECPDEIKHVLRIRTYHAMKAVAKYTSIQNAVSSGSRLRGMLMYWGSITGRWAGRIVQLQNIFRPVIEDPDTAIDAFRARDLKWIAALYDDVNPMKVFASCVRGMLVPKKGHDFIVYDSSQIEARVLPWVANQEDTLEVFEAGSDIYKYAASQIFNKKVENIDKDSRFIGKTAILALGYQGGKKAFAKMAKNYGVEISEEFAEEIKVDWRRANPKIVKLWYATEEAAIAAVANPGSVFQADGMKKIMFKVEGDFLFMRLPSGRRLSYHKPQIDVEGKLTYMGIDTYTRQYKRISTYGGKLCENFTQAIARDMLVHWMFALEAAGYRIVGTVHDEIITEVSEGEGSMEEVNGILCSKPDWAEGLPLAADGYRSKRYRK